MCTVSFQSELAWLVWYVQPAGVVAEHGTPGQPGEDALCVFAIDCYLDTLVRQFLISQRQTVSIRAHCA
jgi:hypothetical protein